MSDYTWTVRLYYKATRSSEDVDYSGFATKEDAYNFKNRLLTEGFMVGHSNVERDGSVVSDCETWLPSSRIEEIFIVSNPVKNDEDGVYYFEEVNDEQGTHH